MMESEAAGFAMEDELEDLSDEGDDEKEVSFPDKDVATASPAAPEQEVVIGLLEKQVEQYPDAYACHKSLVSALIGHDDVAKWRKARDRMIQKFPCPPDVWQQWLAVEKSLAKTTSEQNSLLDLYEAATRDYLSVTLWCSYLELAQQLLFQSARATGSLLPSKLELARVRKLGEKAILEVGEHLAQGCFVWEQVIALETTLLLMMKEEMAKSENVTSEDVERQRSVVNELYQRCLKVPLIPSIDEDGDEENKWEEYEYWRQSEYGDRSGQGGDPIVTEFKKAYQVAQRAVRDRNGFEKAVANLGSDFMQTEGHASRLGLGDAEGKLQRAWTNYLNFEKSRVKKQGQGGNRCVTLFERAIAELFLVPEVWHALIDFLKMHHRVQPKIASTTERAHRNVPWSGRVCVDLLLHRERSLGASSVGETAAAARGELTRIAETSLAAIQSPADGVSVCLTMCAFYRRAAEIGADASPQSNLSEQEKADLVTSLRQMFRKATGYLTMIPQDQDKDDLCYEVYSSWAELEVRYIGGLQAARGLWEEVLEMRPNDGRLYIEYIDMERTFGGGGAASGQVVRELYKRALGVFCGSGREKAMEHADWREREAWQNKQELVVKSWVRYERLCGSLSQLEKATQKCNRILDRLQQRKDKVFLAKQQGRVQTVAPAQRSAAAAPPELKDGDWVCVESTCGNVNFARRTECNRCKAPKPKSEASGKAGAKEAGGKAGGKAGDKESRKRPRDAAAAADSSSGKRAKAVGGGKQPAGAAAAQSAGSPGEADEQAKEKESSTEQKSKEEELNALKLDTTGKTLFVLNFPWTVTKSTLLDLFSKYGQVKNCVLKKFAGLSNGRAYVQFTAVDMAKRAAAEVDGSTLEGRIISVTITKPPTARQDEKLADTTVYVRGLPAVENLRSLLDQRFKACGEILDIRVARDREGQPKKFAFVEFCDEKSVKAALELSGSILEAEVAKKEQDQEVMKTKKFKLNVSVYKPSDKDKKKKAKQSFVETKEKTRRKHKAGALQLVPAALRRKNRGAQAAANKPANTANTANTAQQPAQPVVPKSNADFRNLFTKK